MLVDGGWMAGSCWVAVGWLIVVASIGWRGWLLGGCWAANRGGGGTAWYVMRAGRLANVLQHLNQRGQDLWRRRPRFWHRRHRCTA